MTGPFRRLIGGAVPIRGIAIRASLDHAAVIIHGDDLVGLEAEFGIRGQTTVDRVAGATTGDDLSTRRGDARVGNNHCAGVGVDDVEGIAGALGYNADGGRAVAVHLNVEADVVEIQVTAAGAIVDPAFIMIEGGGGGIVVAITVGRAGSGPLREAIGPGGEGDVVNEAATHAVDDGRNDIEVIAVHFSLGAGPDRAVNLERGQVAVVGAH